MNLKLPVLVAVFASAPAFAHHHHHFFGTHHSSSHHASPGVCLRWANVPVAASLDAGALDEQGLEELDGGEDLDGGDELELDGGEMEEDDAGVVPVGTVRVCVERAPAFGCSAAGAGGAGWIGLSVLTLVMVARRRVRC
jgi:uncharacterized protein (TIGR03382 family)